MCEMDSNELLNHFMKAVERVDEIARKCAEEAQFRFIMHPDRFKAECEPGGGFYGMRIIEDPRGYIVNGCFVQTWELCGYDDCFKIDVSVLTQPELKMESPPFDIGDYVYGTSFGWG